MNIEDKLEKGIFASRWLVAPIYIVLCFCLALLTAKVLQQFIIVVPDSISMSIKDVILFVLHVVDLALLANLVLMIIFSGYENFVSKISIAETSEDKPSWMGKVDFSDLKLELTVNKVLKQSGNCIDMIWNPNEILCELSRDFNLEAGDLIFTGTPSGVGDLKKGDLITASIPGFITHSFSII